MKLIEDKVLRINPWNSHRHLAIVDVIADMIIVIYIHIGKKMLIHYFHSFDFKKLKKNSLKQKFLIVFLVFKVLCKNQQVGKCMLKVSKTTYCNIFFKCYFADLVC